MKWLGCQKNWYLSGEDIGKLEGLKASPNEILGLRYGIGVHYGAAKNKKEYLRTVEYLFQTKKLKFVIATGSLSYGINMPTSNVVFVGNSNFLTGMMFRQCAGRAGRRGYGSGIGNVYFAGFNIHTIMRKMCLPMDALSPQLAITPAVLLRLTARCCAPQDQEKKWIDNLALRVLTNPLFRCLIETDSRREMFEQALVHSCFFSWSFFYERGYLKSTGQPTMKCDLPIRIYYMDPECFILAEMLTDCVDSSHSVSSVTLLALVPGSGSKALANKDELDMAVLAILDYLLGRGNVRHSRFAADYRLNDVVQQIWYDYSVNVFKQYTGYMQALSANMIDRGLPLDLPQSVDQFLRWSRERGLAVTSDIHARAPQACLSGRGDDFSSVEEMIMCGKDGIFASSNVIPTSDPTPHVHHRIKCVYTTGKFAQDDYDGEKVIEKFSSTLQAVLASIETMCEGVTLTPQATELMESFKRVINKFKTQHMKAKHSENAFGIVVKTERNRNGELCGRLRRVDKDESIADYIWPEDLGDFREGACVRYLRVKSSDGGLSH
jgi:hypothetical protein